MACFNGTEVQRFFIIGHWVQNWSEDILIFKSWNIQKATIAKKYCSWDIHGIFRNIDRIMIEDSWICGLLMLTKTEHFLGKLQDRNG